MTISRLWRINDIVKSLNALEKPDIDFTYVFILDRSTQTWEAYKKKLESVGDDVVIIETGNSGISESSIYARRERIKDLMQLAQKKIPTYSEVLFVLEDDTDFPKDSLMTLLSSYRSLNNINTNLGYISGVQAGRWGFKMIGLWNADDIGDPQELKTLPYTDAKLFEKIDSAGLYCMLISRDIFLEGEFSVNDFGPDVNFGLSLRRQGYRNFADWDVKCGHVTKRDNIQIDDKCISLIYRKEDEKWKLKPVRKG